MWKIRCDLLKCSYFFDCCSIGVKLQWETLSYLCGGIPQISPILLVLECCSCTSNGCITRACQCQFIALLYSSTFPFFILYSECHKPFETRNCRKLRGGGGGRMLVYSSCGWLLLSPQKISFVIEHEKLKEKKLPFYYCRVCSHRTSTETALL